MKKLKLKTSNLQSPYYIKRFKDGTIMQLKKLVKPVVYVREYNLRNMPEGLLSHCGLEQALYVYVGHNSQELMSYRDADIRCKYNNGHSMHKDYRSFLDRLNAFCELLKVDGNIKDNMMFERSKVRYICNSKSEAHELEKGLAGHYKWLQTFNDISECNTYLLSDTDCIFKDYNKNGAIALKLK